MHEGVKLDNLIQVAHNVEIGKNTVMASQVGAEENLFFPEDGRHTVDRNIPSFQFCQVVLPKLILDEEGHVRLGQIQETLYVAQG